MIARGFKILTLVVVIGLIVDYQLVRAKERRVSGVISASGGRMASIPLWPLGTEYRITFPHTLTAKQLADLSEANRLRGWVGIAFDAAEITPEEAHMMREALPRCHLFQRVEGRLKPLPDEG